MTAVLDISTVEDWTYLAYQSIETGYPLQDVVVITSRSHYIDLVHLAAVQRLVDNGESLSIESIVRMALEVADDVSIYTTERVVVRPDGITVFLNTDEISADSVTPVCQMVSDALYELDGEYGDVEFSEPMQFLVH